MIVDRGCCTGIQTSLKFFLKVAAIISYSMSCVNSLKNNSGNLVKESHRSNIHQEEQTYRDKFYNWSRVVLSSEFGENIKNLFIFASCIYMIYVIIKLLTQCVSTKENGMIETNKDGVNNIKATEDNKNFSVEKGTKETSFLVRLGNKEFASLINELTE